MNVPPSKSSKSVSSLSDSTKVSLGLVRWIFGGIATGIIASFVMWMNIASATSANSATVDAVVKRLDKHEILLTNIQDSLTNVRITLASNGHNTATDKLEKPGGD